MDDTCQCDECSKGRMKLYIEFQALTDLIFQSLQQQLYVNVGLSINTINQLNSSSDISQGLERNFFREYRE